MNVQGKNRPVTEMFIERDQNSILINCFFQDFSIVRPRLPCFRGTNHIMTCISQGLGNFHPEHLLEIEPERFRHVPLP